MRSAKSLPTVFCGAVLLCVAHSAGATGVDTVVALGYEPGGDTLLRVVFKDGSAHTVSANQGANLRLGAMFYHTENLTWQTQATLGIQYNTLNAKNGTAEWAAYPLEVIGFYNANLVRVGGGIVYQLNPHLRTTGVVSSYGADLDNAIGLIAQVGFRAKKQQGLSVDLRYTSIKYSGDATYAGVPQHVKDVSGSSVGIFLTAMF